jgi:hypothetical protein
LVSPARARTLLQVAAVCGVLLLSFVVRVVSSASSELSTADAAMSRGDVDAAIVHYRRAGRWYAPGSPYHVEALDRLAQIGVRAERGKDTDQALAAYRAVRSAIMSTRSFYVPERARLDAADRRIAALMASLPAPPMDAGKSREQIEAEHLALLQEVPGPSVGWSMVLLLGFAAWLGGAFAFTLRAIDAEDRFVRHEALRWSVVMAVGFGLFVLGMSLA